MFCIEYYERGIMSNKLYTPLIRIKYKYNDKTKYIYAKLEYYNLTGSIKDRVAKYILEDAINSDLVCSNTPIIEASSGNTGIALAALCAKNKLPLHIFIPKHISKERKILLESYGAHIHEIKKRKNSFVACVNEAKLFAEKEHGYFTNQFSNDANYLAHYNSTGKEIIKQLDTKIDGFVSGVGTGGTLMGISDRLKSKYPNISVVAIEPSSMPILSNGKIIKKHKIEGIGDDFIPELIDKNKIDDVILIDDDDAINMSKKLCYELGLGVGISSGANFLGSVLLNDEKKYPIVTVFADDNKKYYSTELFKKKKINHDLISNNIELLDYEFI